MRIKEPMDSLPRLKEVHKMSNSLYGSFRNPKFTDVFGDVGTFIQEAEESYLNLLDRNHLGILYYLLYGNYGNSVIASDDIEQFKYKMWSIIFMYGPTWAKRLDIQEKLRNLSEDEIKKGSKAVYNHAYNPSTAPSTATLTELTTIDNQNTTNYVRSTIEGYAALTDLLETDVTKEFIDKFKKLFLLIVQPEEKLLYGSENIYGD